MYGNFSTALLSAATILSQLALGCDIYNVKQDDHFETILQANEFSIASFIKDEPEIMEIDALLEGACAIIEEKLNSKEWPARQLSWLRLDLDKLPEQENNIFKPGLTIVKGTGEVKQLGFVKHYEKQEQNEELLAMIVREMTGEWFTPIECDLIQGDDRKFYDEFVYFGDEEDLEEGGVAHSLNQLSLADRYMFMDSRVGFYYNTDPACREEFNLEKDQKHIVMFHGEAKPDIRTVDKDYIEIEELMRTLQIGVVRGTPQWGQRASQTIFQYKQSALIYYMPEGETRESISKDWRVILMSKVNEWIQEQDAGFIPIVQTWEADSREKLHVTPLREILGIESQGELPHFYHFDAAAKQTTRYPDPLISVDKFTPELILHWAEMTSHKKIAKLARKRLDTDNSITEDLIDTLKGLIKSSHESVKKIRAADDEIREKIAKENIFAQFVKQVLSDAPQPQSQSSEAKEEVALEKEDFETQEDALARHQREAASETQKDAVDAAQHSEEL